MCQLSKGNAFIVYKTIGLKYIPSAASTFGRLSHCNSSCAEDSPAFNPQSSTKDDLPVVLEEEDKWTHKECKKRNKEKRKGLLKYILFSQFCEL